MATKPYGQENLKKLRQIVARHQHSQLSFEKGGRARVDALTAQVLIKVYNALGLKGKEKFVRMLETKAGFGRLLNFAWKQIK